MRGSPTAVFSDLPYRPQDPRAYRPAIGLIGCGGITREHLQAYRNAGYNITMLCDLTLSKAEKRRAEFFPDARVTTDFREVLRDDLIEVVDIATHPPERPPLITAAIEAGKHVLSQKPFVLDLDEGCRLADLADQKQVHLAVNQNGRWAPHFSYARQAIAAGWLGDLAAAHLDVHWDHTWVAGTEFAKIRNLVLYDFAIHWFDILLCFFGEQPAQRVYASHAWWPGQSISPPLMAQALIEFDHAQASLTFDAAVQHAPCDRTYLAGTRGTLESTGPDLLQQSVRLTTSEGTHQPELAGRWFPDGFHGTMGELLCSIEEGREPTISARRNLRSLALCFAAVASSERHVPIVPGSIRRLACGF